MKCRYENVRLYFLRKVHFHLKNLDAVKTHARFHENDFFTDMM